MKKLLIYFSLFTFHFSLIHAQTISTVAGNYALGEGYSGDGGPATAAELARPISVAFDASGDLYIADFFNDVIRKVNTSGIISTVAGNNAFGPGYSGDGGPATAAELYDVYGVALDTSGNLYIADFVNNVIREVNTSGTISTAAGNHAFGRGYSGDGGPATAAELYDPIGIACDASGNLYIADQFNQVIRKVNTSGTINTVAGNYTFGGGYSGDGGPATTAELSAPTGITLDNSGNLYIVDDNNVIRMVNAAGTISTVAGNIAFGNGYSGDGGSATAAELDAPWGVACDASGNFYIADVGNNVIRKVNTSGTINTIAGNGYGAGTGSRYGGYSGDGGPATAAELYEPIGVALDASDNLFIADYRNNVIRRVTPTPCTLSEASPTINQNVSCYGGSNGSVTAAISSGGTPPYTYQWNAGTTSTNATNSNLIAGIYTVSITDSTGCTATALVIITQPPALHDSISSSCATCCNCKGATHVYAYGGTSPYTYLWSNGGTYDTLQHLSSDTFRVTVWDSNGCSITDSIFVHKGEAVSASQTNLTCYLSSNGSATVFINGNYSYSWTPGGEATSSISDLSAGSYTVTITNNDTAGCSASYSFDITQPPPLSATYTLTPVTGIYNTVNLCADSLCIMCVATAMGGTPPYTYSYPFSPYCFDGDDDALITDKNGCPYDEYFEPPFIAPSYRVRINNNVLCHGESTGSATINQLTGSSAGWGLGGYYRYRWMPGGDTTQTVSNLSAGTYTVTLIDSIAYDPPYCDVSAVFVITQPSALSITTDSINASPGNCDGSASAIVSGGISPYTYSWTTAGQTTATISNQCAGDYCCNVTDANGCQNSVCVTIATSTGTNEVKGESENVKVYPNPNNGAFTVTFSHAELVSASQPIARVINVLGQQVYFATLNQVQGDNFIDISSQPDGIYLIRIENEDGSLIAQKKIVKM